MTSPASWFPDSQTSLMAVDLHKREKIGSASIDRIGYLVVFPVAFEIFSLVLI